MASKNTISLTIKKVYLIDPYHWREKSLHPCAHDTTSNYWWHKKTGAFPKCKRHARYRYADKEYCSLHMGEVLLDQAMLATQKDQK